jgi:hypothetical protein
VYVAPLLVGSEWIVAGPYKVLRAAKIHPPMSALVSQLYPTMIPPTRTPNSAPTTVPTKTLER